MTKTLIFRKIGGIISEITEQYQYLASDPENINPLELELFVANSHFLSEHLAILKKLDGNINSANVSHSDKQSQQKEDSIGSNVLSPEKEEATPEAPQAIPAIPYQPDEISGISVDTDIKESLFNASESESEAFFKDIKTVEELSHQDPKDVPAKTPEVAEVPVEAISIPADTELESVKESMPVNNNLNFSYQDKVNPATDDRIPTLNEILSAGKKTETIISNINQFENKDLKAMIKLNDKLMFVRDLFNGYSLAYSEAIEFINRFDNFAAADNFLKHNYAVKNRWSEKQSSVDQFYEILHKRFS